MKLINIGFGNLVSADRLVAVVGPDSAPIKRMVQESGAGNADRRHLRPQDRVHFYHGQ